MIGRLLHSLGICVGNLVAWADCVQGSPEGGGAATRPESTTPVYYKPFEFLSLGLLAYVGDAKALTQVKLCLGLRDTFPVRSSLPITICLLLYRLFYNCLLPVSGLQHK